MRFSGPGRGLAAALLAGALAATAGAQTSEELRNDGKNTDNVLTYGMGYHQNRYSTLKQINKSNVKRLVPVWSMSLSSNYGEQGQPLVYNGVMYVDQRRVHGRDRRRHRQADLAHAGRVRSGHAARRVLRHLEQGPGHLQRQGLPRHARRARRRARPEDRQAGLEGEGRRMEGRLLDDRRAAGRQRRADHRHLRRRVRRARLHRRPRSRDRQAPVAHATPFPAPARRGTTRGRPATPICAAAARPGSPAPTTPSSISPTGAPATPGRGIPPCGRATTSTPPRCSRSGRRPARSSGTSSSSRTRCTTSTRTGR